MNGESPLGWLWLLAGVLAAAGVYVSRRAWRQLRTGGAARPATNETTAILVRGFRSLSVAIGLFAFAAGIAFRELWLFIFGAAFVAEELLETSMMSLALWFGKSKEAGARSAPVTAPGEGPAAEAGKPSAGQS